MKIISYHSLLTSVKLFKPKAGASNKIKVRMGAAQSIVKSFLIAT